VEPSPYAVLAVSICAWAAGVMATDSPQPQALDWFGLLKTKAALSLSTLKSSSVPNRNRIAVGSIRILTPFSSTTSSCGPKLSAYCMVYSMPAQPPFFTPTRMPTIGSWELAVTWRMRSTAASDNVITGLGLGWLMAGSPVVGIADGFAGWSAQHQNILRVSFASSDMRSLSHGGSNVSVTFA